VWGSVGQRAAKGAACGSVGQRGAAWGSVGQNGTVWGNAGQHGSTEASVAKPKGLGCWAEGLGSTVQGRPSRVDGVWVGRSLGRRAELYRA
jgi:hypothetical protein